MTYYLFMLAILIWPFGQLLNFHIPGLSLTIYPLDLVSGLLSLSLLISPKSRSAISRDVLFKPLSLFLLVASLSLLLNLTSALAGGLGYSIFYLIRLFVYPSVYFSAKILNRKKIIPFVLLSLFIFFLFGLAQYLFSPDMSYLKYLGFDDHYYRLIGSLYDPNFSGAILAGTALIFVSLGQWFLALPVTLLLALTFSRASYLIFSLGLVYLVVTQKKWSLLILLIILSCFLILIPKPFGEGVNLLRTVSIFSRFDSWSTGWDLFRQRPLFGWGYNTFRFINGERFQIDNSYLYIAATTGLIGLAAFINLLKQIVFLVKSQPSKIFILAILIHSLFNNSFFYIWINYSFWLILALPLKEYKQVKTLSR